MENETIETKFKCGMRTRSTITQNADGDDIIVIEVKFDKEDEFLELIEAQLNRTNFN